MKNLYEKMKKIVFLFINIIFISSTTNAEQSSLEEVAISSLEHQCKSKEDKVFIKDLDKRISDLNLNLEELCKSRACSESYKEENHIENLQTLSEDKVKAEKDWNSFLSNTNIDEDRFPAVYIPAGCVPVSDLVKILAKGKEVLGEIKDLENFEINIPFKRNVPLSSSVNYLNTVLVEYGFFAYENSNSLTVKKSSFGKDTSFPDAIINISESFENIVAKKVLVFAEISKNQSSVFCDAISNYLNISPSPYEKYVTFVSSMQDAKIAKKIYESIVESSSRFSIDSVCLKSLSKEKVAFVIHSLKNRKTLNPSSYVSAVHLGVNNEVILIGESYNVKVLKRELVGLDSRLSQSMKNKEFFSYKAKKMSFETIASFSEKHLGIPKENIFEDKKTGEFLFVSEPETISDLKKFLKDNDKVPRTVTIDCIIIETSKNKNEKFSSQWGKTESVEPTLARMVLDSSRLTLGSCVSSCVSDFAKFFQVASISVLRSTKIKSVQSITLSDNRLGKIKFVTEISISSGNKENGEKHRISSFLSRQEYGLSLDILSRVINEKFIIMDIVSKFDSIDKINEKPEVKKRYLETKDLVARNGEMIQIGKIDHSELCEEKDYSFKGGIIAYVLDKLWLWPRNQIDSSLKKDMVLQIAVIPRLHEEK